MARTKSLTKNLKLRDIILDKELYPRSNTYWQTSHQYKEEMRAGANFPAIVVAELNGKYILVDGQHRKEALIQLKVKTTKCEVLIGLTRKEIFEEAIKRNIAHGQSLSPYDKRLIALKLRNAKYSLNSISQLIQVPLDNIENFISQRLVNSITGDTIGENLIVKSGLKHLAGRNVSPNEMQTIMVSQQGISVGSQLSLLNQMIEILENELFDLSNKEILEKLQTIKKLL